eukprot:403365389
MQNELERIFKARQEHLKTIVTKEDKSQQQQNSQNGNGSNGNNGNSENQKNYHDNGHSHLDNSSSQTKENFYKEEFMKQMKLMDQAPSSASPSNLLFQQLNGGILNQLDSYTAQQQISLQQQHQQQMQKLQLNALQSLVLEFGGATGTNNTGGSSGTAGNQNQQNAQNNGMQQFQQQIKSKIYNVFDTLSEEDQMKFEKAQTNIANFLDDLTLEQKEFNFHSPNIANKMTEAIGKEISQFCTQLVEKKRNQPRDLHNLPATTLALQLGDTAGQDQQNLKSKKDDKEKYDAREQLITEKLDWIRLKKKITNFEEISPLTISIEQIFTLPSDLKLNDDATIAQSLGNTYQRQESSNARNQSQSKSPLRDQSQVKTDKENKKKELRELLQLDTSINKMDSKKRKNLEKFVNELFSEHMEVESWVCGKETLPISESINSGNSNYMQIPNLNTMNGTNTLEPSQQSINMMQHLEQIELADMNFFRDLGPLSRELSIPKDSKLQRKIQKKVLENYIEIEPFQQNLSDDMYLLALSGLVPIDKLIKRMNNLKKWEVENTVGSMGGHFDSIIQTSPSSSSDFSDSDVEDNKAQQSKIDKKQLSKKKIDQKKRISKDESVKDINQRELNKEIQKINLFDQQNDQLLTLYGTDGAAGVNDTNSDENQFFDKKRPSGQGTAMDQSSQMQINESLKNDSIEQLLYVQKRKQTDQQSIEEQKRQEYINIFKSKREASSSNERSQQNSLGRNFKPNQNQNPQNVYMQGALEKFNQHDLSVISEVQQSVADQSMTKEILKTFSNSRGAALQQQNNLNMSMNQNNLTSNFNPYNSNSESPQLRIRQGSNQPQSKIPTHRANQQSSQSLIQLQNMKQAQPNTINQEVLEPVLTIPEYEQQIIQKLKMIEELITAKRQLETDQEAMTKQLHRKQTQNLKNMERMRAEINKRVEQYLVEIIKVLDDHSNLNNFDDDDEGAQQQQQIISTDTILKGSVIQTEDIDETIKAKFLTRLVREYRKNRERAKQGQLKEQMEKEIEENIYKRFPSLGNSPERQSKRSGSRGDSTFRIGLNNSKIYPSQMHSQMNIKRSQSPPMQNSTNQLQSQNNTFRGINDNQHAAQTARGNYNTKKANMSNMFENDDITHMKKGWGVNQSRNNGKASNALTTKMQQAFQTQIKIAPNVMYLQDTKDLKPPPIMKVNHFRKQPANQNQQNQNKANKQVNKNQQSNVQKTRKVSNFDQNYNKNQDSDEDYINPKKMPMREQHISYTPNTALMNGVRRKITSDKGFGGVAMNLMNSNANVFSKQQKQTQKKRSGMLQQDEDPPIDQEWIQGGGSTTQNQRNGYRGPKVSGGEGYSTSLLHTEFEDDDGSWVN